MNHEMHDMENMDGHHHDEPVEDSEIKSWKQKLVWSWVLTIPIAILMLSERLFGFFLLFRSLFGVLLEFLIDLRQ